MDILLRFLIGGVVVSVFAILGDMVKPESLGGVFAAAPTIAFATLLLTLHKDGAAYIAIEARSMVAGAIAFFRLCVLCELYTRALAAEIDGGRHRINASVVCNSSGPLGALAAEIGRCG